MSYCSPITTRTSTIKGFTTTKFTFLFIILTIRIMFLISHS
nr:MAG TPA: hypothetical protein [Bacteriophage sp.]